MQTIYATQRRRSAARDVATGRLLVAVLILASALVICAFAPFGGFEILVALMVAMVAMAMVEN